MKKHKCKICEHEWYPRSKESPLACPKCKRYDWDRTTEVRKYETYS